MTMFVASGPVQKNSINSCSSCRPPFLRIPSDCLVLLSLSSIVSFFWKSLYQGVSSPSARDSYYLYKQLNSAVYCESKHGVLGQALSSSKVQSHNRKSGKKVRGEKRCGFKGIQWFLIKSVSSTVSMRAIISC